MTFTMLKVIISNPITGYEEAFNLTDIEDLKNLSQQMFIKMLIFGNYNIVIKDA